MDDGVHRALAGAKRGYVEDYGEDGMPCRLRLFIIQYGLAELLYILFKELLECLRGRQILVVFWLVKNTPYADEGIIVLVQLLEFDYEFLRHLLNVFWELFVVAVVHRGRVSLFRGRLPLSAGGRKLCLLFFFKFDIFCLNFRRPHQCVDRNDRNLVFSNF